MEVLYRPVARAYAELARAGNSGNQIRFGALGCFGYVVDLREQCRQRRR